MEKIILEWGAATGLLFSIVAFFSRQIVRRLEEGNKTLLSLDKHVAVLSGKIDQLEKSYLKLDSFVEQNKREIQDLRLKVIENAPRKDR